MPDSRFSQSLNQQVAYAVHYDNDALQLLAAYFYAQALEERNHAMMMVQYLMDADLPVTIPAVEAPITSFTSLSAPIALALDQEKRVSAQIADLVRLAREDGDYQSEQFLQWFLKEQVEEVASMTTLLRIVERAGDNPLLVEDYLARTPRADDSDPTAPTAAGGAL
jgi:ferritin